MLLFVPEPGPEPAPAGARGAGHQRRHQSVRRRELRRLLAMRRSEFSLAVACGAGRRLAGVLPGIVIAVLIAILQFVVRAWRPYSAVLGRPAGLAGYHDITRYPEAVLIPGLLILRWDAPLFFANANLFRDMVRQRVAEADAQAALGAARRRADHRCRHDRRRRPGGPGRGAECRRRPPRVRGAQRSGEGHDRRATACSKPSTTAASFPPSMSRWRRSNLRTRETEARFRQRFIRFLSSENAGLLLGPLWGKTPCPA